MKLRELRRKIPGKKVRPLVSKSVTRPKMPRKVLKKTPSLLLANSKTPQDLFTPKSGSLDPLLDLSEKLGKLKSTKAIPTVVKKIQPRLSHPVKKAEPKGQQE